MSAVVGGVGRFVDRLRAPQNVRRLAAVTTGLAGTLHLTVVPEHRAEWWLAGALFTLVGCGQLWWALMVWPGGGSRLLLSGTGLNLAVLAAWFVSRTVGLPFGPHAGAAEAVGAIDLVTAVVEAVAVAAVVLILLPGSRLRRT
jgi:hypothetical protein